MKKQKIISLNCSTSYHEKKIYKLNPRNIIFFNNHLLFEYNIFIKINIIIEINIFRFIYLKVKSHYHHLISSNYYL